MSAYSKSSLLHTGEAGEAAAKVTRRSPRSKGAVTALRAPHVVLFAIVGEVALAQTGSGTEAGLGRARDGLDFVQLDLRGGTGVTAGPGPRRLARWSSLIASRP